MSAFVTESFCSTSLHNLFRNHLRNDLLNGYGRYLGPLCCFSLFYAGLLSRPNLWPYTIGDPCSGEADQVPDYQQAALESVHSRE